MVHSRSRFAAAGMLRRLTAAAAAACALTAMAAEPPKEQHLVQDPHYGDVLFHFFQDKHFTAITSLMVSQHFNRMQHHADEAEVLRGGMLLSYGLHREAGQIFAQLIEKTSKPAVRDRAWFYLAKIRHQRGFYGEAEEALNRIQGQLPPPLEEDRGLLKAQLMMARNDYAGAAAALDAMVGPKDAKAESSRYARFNLGVALIRSGDSARGNAVLDELGRMTAPDEESRSLRDRTNVALGFAALKDNQPEKAREHLGRVRLKSMQANKALLGFGWAAASMKDPKSALIPWQELSERDPSDSAVLEARIAVPYAYAEMGAYGQALARYNEAISVFEKESKALDESIAAVREGKLLKGLLESNPGDEMGWFWQIDKLPEMPHAGHLAPLLAQHEFQEAFKNYRDLLFLARNLQGWADNLGVFGDMLDNRRKAFAERLPKVRQDAANTGLSALQQRRDAVAAEVAAAEQAADGVALADARQRALLARLQSVKDTLAKLGDAPEHAAARERARLAAGALTWELAQQHTARMWEANKAMKTIDAELEGAKRRDAALAQAERDEPARFDAFGQRIASLSGQVQALMPRVASLTKEQQEAVQELAVAELQRQKERLQVYTVQARFAVAQLYDRATQSWEGKDAARP
jgi:tetratricopeptide (TPR) repeat protein